MLKLLAGAGNRVLTLRVTYREHEPCPRAESMRPATDGTPPL